MRFIQNAALSGAAVFVVVVLALSASLEPAYAQRCETPLCRGDDSYQRGGTDSDGPYGVCGGCNWLGHCSHYIVRCGPDATLNIERGVCVLNACSSCGAELPLCDDNETYQRSGEDADGVYGVCGGGGGIGGYLYHRLAYCAEGWTLQTDTGMCRKMCAALVPGIKPGIIGPVTPVPVKPLTLPRPDLILRRAWLRAPKGGLLKTLRRGKPYYACFEVANQGDAASGPFHVGAGGLGVPVAPEQAHAGLAPGASRQGCLYYETTPPPGNYQLGITADSHHVVAESREDNNDRTLSVRVRL